jgi:hypothetical protein
MITPSNLFSFLTKTLSSINSGFRTFLAGSIAGVYALVLYEGFPQYLFELNNSVFYFVMPVSIISSVLIAVPKFLSKGSSPRQAKAPAQQEDPLLNELLGEPTQTISSEAASAEATTEIGKIGGANAELEALLSGATPPMQSETITTETQVAPTVTEFDENRIRELIDQKFEPVEKDLTTFKKDLNKIKEDMKVTKESVDTLTESFEGTLTDMKAFQAEISNPLNFMRKYFEALDLSNLSDPSLPLKQGILQGNLPTPPSQPQQATQPQIQQNPIPVMVQAGGVSQPTMAPQPTPSPTAIVQGSEMDSLVKGTDLGNPMDSMMKPLFSGNLSVANMMAIVELVGEMFAEKGEDCIDLLVEQCKLMGLKPEDEHTIYNIIDMLKNSGMSTDDAISQLYKFAKIVGLNDKESDAYYARLCARSKRERSD